MKKRILAMLLVLCLVMSVMPMTVLAAEAECPYEGTEHTLENCEATLVLAVPAENCQQRSYELYSCNKCGDLFAANFGDEGDHVLVLVDQEVPAKECGYGLKCEVCGWPVPHDFGCDGVCVCGAKGDPGHKWDQELIQITKEPVGCSVPGEATYTCADCGATKIAPVYGKHVEKEHIAYMAPDCENTGVKEHDYCAACGTYWIGAEEVEADDVIIPAQHKLPVAVNNYTALANGAFDAAGPNGFVGLMIVEVKSTSAQVVVYACPKNTWVRDPAQHAVGTVAAGAEGVITVSLDGTKNPGVKIYAGEADVEVSYIGSADLKTWIAPTCESAGIYQVECEECGKLITGQTSMTAHQWVLDGLRSQPASCTKYGYEFWICADCGEAKPIKIIPKLNCVDTWAEVVAANKAEEDSVQVLLEVAPTCSKPGNYAWKCPICGPSGEIKTWTPAATGCNLATATVPATKHSDGYVFKYCTNENCDKVSSYTFEQLIAFGVYIDGKAGHCSDGIKLDGKCVHAIVSVLPANDKLDHEWTLLTTTATCILPGYEFYTCSCGEVKRVAVQAYGHSAYDTIADNNIPDLIVEEATCTTLGYSFYECADCHEQVYVTKDVPFVHKTLMTVEEFAKYHGMWMPVDPQDPTKGFEWVSAPIASGDWIVAPSCGKEGYAVVDCPYCDVNEHLAPGHNQIVIVAGGAHVWDEGRNGTSKIPAAECEDAYFYCAICDANKDTKSYKIAGTGHDWSVPAVKGDCFTDGHKGYGICSKCGEERSAEDAELDPAGHIWANDAVIAPDCDKWGGQPQTCSRGCDCSQIIYYVPNTHYVGIDGTVTMTSDPVPACKESGKEVFECSKCDYKYEVNVEKLGYHVNAAGYRIYPDKCLDCNFSIHNITDWRDLPMNYYTCQYCCRYGQYVVTNLGKWATCTEAGYNVFAFTCGHNGNYGYTPPLGHKWSSSKVDIKTGDYAYMYKANICENGCGLEENPESLKNVKFEISNDLGMNEVFHDGAYINITVDIAAYEAAIYGYYFELHYDADVLEFVNANIVSKNFQFNSYAINNLVDNCTYDKDGNVTATDWNGYVAVCGQSAEEGKNVTLKGYEEQVVITFKAIAAGETKLELKNIETEKNVKSGTKYVSADVVCLDPVAHNLVALTLMDATGDGKITWKDAVQVWQLAAGTISGDYKENLDINCNGRLDYADAKFIYKCAMGLYSYEEVLELYAENLANA